MAKFIPLKDKNTGVVYEWRMIEDSGAESVKTLFREQWKPERDWTQEELKELFSVEPKVKTVEQEEAQDDEPLFSEDFSTPGEE